MKHLAQDETARSFAFNFFFFCFFCFLNGLEFDDYFDFNPFMTEAVIM